MGGRFDGSPIGYFIPTDSKALVSSGANNMYIVGKNQTLKIAVSTADVYMKFMTDASAAVADSTNVMLKLGEHFVNSGENTFMSISTSANANVVKVE